MNSHQPYHVIENPCIHAATAFLLEHLPATLRLVIAARGRPPLPLGRLRACRRLVELDTTALRFSPDEAVTFLQATMKLPLEAGDVAALVARTEGWPAGLCLAALALQGQADVTTVERAFQGDHHLVADYLIDEILRRQPAPIQTFLLHTSILDRLCAPLCAALLKGPDGAAVEASQLMLEYLERANLFLMPLDEQRSWFRYHQLFADALRAHLRLHHPEQMVALHRRAAAWLAAADLASEAIEHALLARDHALAARLIGEIANELWLRGELVTLQRWLGALPRDAIAECPSLAGMHSFMLFQAGHIQQADLAVQQFARQWVAQETPPDDQAAFLALLRTIQALAQGTALPPLPPLPADLSVWSDVVALNLGISYELQGAVSVASAALASAETLSRAHGHADVAFLATCYQAASLVEMGQLEMAAERYQQLLSQMRSCQLILAPVVSIALLGLAQIFYEWNELDAAAELLEESAVLAQRGGKTDVLLDSWLVMARMAQARGDVGGAHKLLKQALDLARSWNIGVYIGRVGAQQARLRLKQGDVASARRWARGRTLGSDDPFNALVEGDYMTLARLLVAVGHTEEALHLLERIAAAAKRDGRVGRVIEVLLLAALAHQARGEVECALAALAEALTLAEPSMYIRTFVDEGEAMTKLLAQMPARRSPQAAYAAELLAVMSARPFPLADHSVNHGPTTNVAPLTDREEAVLGCVAVGMPTAAIAKRFSVATSTINWHLQNLYNKLGVSSRTQAVASAREMGLLP